MLLKDGDGSGRGKEGRHSHAFFPSLTHAPNATPHPPINQAFMTAIKPPLHTDTEQQRQQQQQHYGGRRLSLSSSLPGGLVGGRRCVRVCRQGLLLLLFPLFDC